MTFYGRWDYKFDEAARQGAAGAIMIHDTLPAAYPWSTVTNGWTGRNFNMVLPDKGEGLASVEGWITREGAEALFSKAGLDLDVMYEKAAKPGFSAVHMGLNASAVLTNETEIVNSRNVAAILAVLPVAESYSTRILSILNVLPSRNASSWVALFARGPAARVRG